MVGFSDLLLLCANEFLFFVLLHLSRSGMSYIVVLLLMQERVWSICYQIEFSHFVIKGISIK